MIPTSEKSSRFTDSVIRRMTRVCNKFGAVNLSQGFPDFDPPKAVTERLAQIAPQGPHQYAITWGAQNTREALASKLRRDTGLKVDPDSELVITCGGTEAMMCAVLSTINPGEKIAIFSP
ncbi:MAG: aminotransferase class I/II-fold pyridoxal phosphate-dependent enzyme, partial [Succinivibrio sp.]